MEPLIFLDKVLLNLAKFKRVAPFTTGAIQYFYFPKLKILLTMFNNYFSKGSSLSVLLCSRRGIEQKLKPNGFGLLLLMLLFAVTGLNAQTQLIPVTDGAFNSGATFAANGWTVANQGTGPVKWTVGNAVSAGAIAGNSAFVSLDNGETNSAAGIATARSVYFYRDIVIPAGQTNIALTFNWKSVGTTWQVFVAPTSVTPVGTDTQLGTIAGATLLLAGTTNAVTQNAFSFIPASYAGTTARLIFMWSSFSGGNNPPAAIDNISVISRAGGNEIASIASGNFTDPAIWDAGYVPSQADDVVITDNTTVSIDAKGIGANNLYVAGINAVLQFAAAGDEFTVNSDMLISGLGAQFKVFEGTNGKSLRVGHDINILSGGRLDASVGSSSANSGALTLFGSTVQTITIDPSSFMGGTIPAAGTTNTVGVVSQLIVTNTSAATPNIIWNADNIRIKNFLRLTSGRIALGSKKIIIGNYSQIFNNNFICNAGSGFIGGAIARWYGTFSTGTTIDAGLDYNPNSAALFPSLSASGNNRWAFICATNTSTAGELTLTYVDANTVNTGLSIADGAYTINSRYNGNWSVSTAGSTYASTSGTFSLGLYGVGAFAANDGFSRIMNTASAAPGSHINGTTTPFVARAGMTIADLTSGPLYIGASSASVQAPANLTTIASGNWNDAAVWSTGIVPTCSSIITIASGHTITVNGTASAGGLTINAGGTLINASGAMTVGCTNNNAVFTNFGTHTVSGGVLTVNGAVYHRTGSTFNHTDGDIIVDSNAGGVVANSVGAGGSSFKLETSNLNMTGGKITIVDPLVNKSEATTATSVNSFTNNTSVTFTKGTSGTAALGASTVNMATLNSSVVLYAVGQLVSGAGIAPGTFITSTFTTLTGNPITLGLSQPTTAAVTSGTQLTFNSMSNGCAVIHFDAANVNNVNVAPGQVVSGPGIQPGTTVTAAYWDSLGSGTFAVALSLPVSGLAVSPTAGPQSISFTGASNGSNTIILSAANPSIVAGQAIAGIGIQPGTIVSNISDLRLTMSLPATSAIVLPASLTFYNGNLNSYAFAYNSPLHYSAGINHTLQIGDGLSNEKGDVITNGFLCNMAQGGGVFSLGNLTINTPDGATRFFNSTNVLNVQNAMTVTSGSVFRRQNTSGGMYFGGNITNNGTFVGGTTQFFLANYANGVQVASTLSQTISGAGTYYNNFDTSLATGSFGNMTVNNTGLGGITINTPNFRVTGSITMTAGIIHTFAATPLYQGLPDHSNAGFISGNFGPTCFIDGPFSKTLPLTNTSFYIFPVGKTAYTPISMSTVGGAVLVAEAFNTNTGTPSVNIGGLSATRWKVARVGTTGTFTDFKVAVGDTPVTASNIVVQATTDQGVYDNVLGSTATFAAAGAGTTNTVTMPTTTPTASFTGFFAYAALPVVNCTAVNPGNTVASATTLCGTQQVTLSLQNPQIGAGITYQWQSSADNVTYSNIANANAATYIASPTAATYYQCIVTCPAGSVTATSTPVQITFSAGITSTTPASRCDAGTLTLGATAATGTINWYAIPSGGASLGTGTSFVTPSLTATTTYYTATETASAPYTAGPALTGTLTQTTPMSGIVFNASSNVHLTSVKVYPKQTAGALDAGAPITIKLFDQNGNQVPGTSSVTFTPVTNTVAVSAASSNTVVLNYNIPAGTGYRLLATYGLSSTNNLARLGTATFPLTTNGITITAGASDFTTNNTSYINFFELTATDVCASPRVAVAATVGCQDCATVGAAITTAVTCFGGDNGTATITMSNLTPSVATISYTVDGSTPQTATLVNGAFLITGLTAGIHSVVVSNAGCPSVTVSATVAGPVAPLTNVTTETACGTYTWAVTGLTYTTGGTYTGTTTNVNGCTVNETLNLTITPVTSNATTAAACDTYTWAVTGLPYTASGVYTSVTNCHTETLNLTITPSTSNTTTATACDTYTWAVTGLPYTASGIYTSVTNCHTETLNLTITPSTSNTTTATACDMYTWTVTGLPYTASGVYTSVVNCHTETLNLTITPSTSNTTTATACDTYTWTVTGLPYTASGVYTSVVNCHTETLNLTITPSTSNTTTATACDTYTWAVTGLAYTASGVYTSVTNCHTETLNLTITPSTSNTTTATACDTYTWAVNGTVYTTSGTYTSVTNCHTETLELTINSAVTPTGDASQTVSVTDANDATLEDLVVSPSTVIWYASANDAQNQVSPLAATTVLTNGATYYAVNVSSGCPSAPLAVTVNVTLGVGGFDSANFTFYPNPTSGILNIAYSSEITKVQVLNMLGQMLLERTTNQNEIQIDLSSLPTATYLVKVESAGKSKVVKVVKQN
jgi:hypothetical protein